jgi:uncharacterized protein
MTDELRIAERMLPQPDAVSQEYWDGLGRGELRLQRCTTCDAVQFYPRALCAQCAGDVEWMTASGTGEVHTFTIVRSNPVEPFRSLVPYVLAIVRTAEGPQMMTNIIGCAPDEVRIGMPVELAPVEADGVWLPFWKPREDA